MMDNVPSSEYHQLSHHDDLSVDDHSVPLCVSLTARQVQEH